LLFHLLSKKVIELLPKSLLNLIAAKKFQPKKPLSFDVKNIWSKKVIFFISCCTKAPLFLALFFSDEENELSRDYLIKHEVFSTCDVRGRL
jgi:hypothetical protein